MPGNEDFELKRETPKVYESFNDYLEMILTANRSNKSFLKSRGSAYDIAESFDKGGTRTVNVHGFDNAIFQKFRQFHKGKCAQCEIDNACMNFGMDAVERASEESGYRKFADMVDKMSYRVEIFNDARTYTLNEFNLSGNKHVTLNVNSETYTRLENMSTDLLVDKASLYKTCLIYSMLSTDEMSCLSWLRDKVCRVNNSNQISFTCKRFRPYFNLFEGLKLRKKDLKTLVFTHMSVYNNLYTLNLYSYEKGRADDEDMQNICEMYKVLRDVLVLAGRRSDSELRERLNIDRPIIKDIKAELESKRGSEQQNEK